MSSEELIKWQFMLYIIFDCVLCNIIDSEIKEVILLMLIYIKIYFIQ